MRMRAVVRVCGNSSQYLGTGGLTIRRTDLEQPRRDNWGPLRVKFIHRRDDQEDHADGKGRNALRGGP